MAPDLLTTQKDEMFEAVRAAGLDPAEFEWASRISWYSETSAPSLGHRPTGHYFMVDWGSTGAGIEYSPADAQPVFQDSSFDWEHIRIHVVIWATALAREASAPNFWARLAQQQELFAAGARDEANTPFAAEELERVDAALAELRELVADTRNLEAVDVAHLDRRIGYLRAAARRVGRVDWLNLVLAAIVQLVLQAVLTSDGAQEVTSLIQSLLGDLFQSVGELPGTS